ASEPGGAILSNTLYGGAGTWTGDPVPTLTYQWRKNGADISGATAMNLALSAHAIGDSIVLRETANNAAGGPVTRDSAAVVIMPDFHVPAPTRLPATQALSVNQVWDVTLLGDTQVFIDGAFVGWTRPDTNTKSFRFAQAGTYTISTSNPVEKCVVTVT
ncbi:MAG: hypothetical protein MUF80_11795, partial [Burkholderiales bacterium]|nr:hypothetical protein [Burkholderiales bacterium]